MHREAGVTLLELLVALAVSSLILLAALALVDHSTRWTSGFGQLVERDQNQWLAPLLLSSWMGPAANNRGREREASLSVGGDSVAVKSDVDGEGGFPDGHLSSPFEDISLRHSRDDLQLRSGEGTFQPILSHVCGFETRREPPDLLRVRLCFQTGEGFSLSGGGSVEETRLSFYLWNFRPGTHAEAPP